MFVYMKISPFVTTKFTLHFFNCYAWFPYSRYRSLNVVDGLSGVIRVSGSSAITASRWLSFRVVDSLSWPLTVFQSLSFKLLFLAPNLLTASLWRSPKVFCWFSYETNKMTGSLAVFQGRSRSLR